MHASVTHTKEDEGEWHDNRSAEAIVLYSRKNCSGPIQEMQERYSRRDGVKVTIRTESGLVVELIPSGTFFYFFNFLF